MADGRASSARKGIDLTDDQVSLMVDKVKAGRSKGQSIRHIFATEQMPCSERTFYRYVDEGLVPIIALDLAKKVRYRSRRKKRAAPSAHEKGFYKGCEYADFLELPPDERARATEVDTVLGARGDRRCMLSLHRVDLRFQLYILLPDKTASSVFAEVNTNYWFYGLVVITSFVGISNLANVHEMQYMFSSCQSVTDLDFRGFDPSHLTNFFYCFAGCNALATIYADATWALPSSGLSGSQCFYNCPNLVGGNGTAWASSKTGYTYFRIDKSGSPGYLTT